MMRRTKDDKRKELIDGLVSARTRLLDAVRSLPEDYCNETFLGTWSIKDLLAHLIGWDFTNLQAVQEILAGQSPTFLQYYDTDWHSYNDRLVRQYRREALSALIAEVEAAHQQLIAYLQSLPAETVVEGKARSPRGRTITIRNLLRSEASDESTHADQVIAFQFDSSRG